MSDAVIDLIVAGAAKPAARTFDRLDPVTGALGASRRGRRLHGLP